MSEQQDTQGKRRLGIPGLVVAAMLLGAGTRAGLVNAELVGSWYESAVHAAVDPADGAPIRSEWKNRGLAEAIRADTDASETEPLAAEPALAAMMAPSTLVSIPDEPALARSIFGSWRAAPKAIDGVGRPLPLPSSSDASDRASSTETESDALRSEPATGCEI